MHPALLFSPFQNNSLSTSSLENAFARTGLLIIQNYRRSDQIEDERQVSEKTEEDKVIRVRCSGKLCGEGVLAGGQSIISACFIAFIDDQTVVIKQDRSL